VTAAPYQVLPAANMIVNTRSTNHQPQHAVLARGDRTGQWHALRWPLSTAQKAQITFVAGKPKHPSPRPSLTPPVRAAINLATVGDNHARQSAFEINSDVAIDGPTGNSGITLAVARGRRCASST